MAKFEKYGDIFSFNKKLMEDDWNDGQKYVLKMKNKGGQFDLTTTVKVAEDKSGSHKLAVSEKAKGVYDVDFLGEGNVFESEATLKNVGDHDYTHKSNFTDKVLGLENSWLTWNGPLGVHPKFGLEWKNDMMKTSTNLDFNGAHTMCNYEGTLRLCDHFTVGKKTSFRLMDPLKGHKTQLALAGHLEKSLQYGFAMNLSSDDKGKQAMNSSSMYFHHGCNSCQTGANVNYDHAKKSFDTKLGLQLVRDDHTWKFRLHDTGTFRAMLQWQLHKACKASLNTTLNLKDVPTGKVAGVPLGLQLDIKY